MPKLYLLFNHTLTPKQEEDAKASLGITQFVSLPDASKQIWGNVPSDLESLAEYLQPIKEFLLHSSEKGDCVLVQGDFGATFHITNWAIQNDLIPLYATTERKSIEEIQAGGTIKKTAIFEHKRFRHYA